MNMDEPYSVSIQSEASPIPSVPAWLGESNPTRNPTF